MAYAGEPELCATTMHPNAQTLTKFYTAFAALDPDRKRKDNGHKDKDARND